MSYANLMPPQNNKGGNISPGMVQRNDHNFIGTRSDAFPFSPNTALKTGGIQAYLNKNSRVSENNTAGSRQSNVLM